MRRHAAAKGAHQDEVVAAATQLALSLAVRHAQREREHVTDERRHAL